MNTQTPATGHTAHDLIAEGVANKPAHTPTEAELPDGVWLMAPALEISHLTGIGIHEAAEVVSRNQALAGRREVASLFQVADRAVATREAA